MSCSKCVNAEVDGRGQRRCGPEPSALKVTSRSICEVNNAGGVGICGRGSLYSCTAFTCSTGLGDTEQLDTGVVLRNK